MATPAARAPAPHAAPRAGRAAPPAGYGTWVTTWSASPQAAIPGAPATAGFSDQTVRDIVHTSVGGSAIRLRLTNAFGSSPLGVGHVTVAVAGRAATLVPGSVHEVTFGGRRAVTIPAGAEVVSDPVAMRVPALRDLAVSLYLPHATGPATNHFDAEQQVWVSRPGDHAADTGAAAYWEGFQSWYFLDGAIVRSAAARATVVAFGDSITDGFGSVAGANRRWPDDLARRLDAVGGTTLAVADEGISGNRLLSPTACCGVSALARLQRDVLSLAGAHEVILLEGINDVGRGRVTAAQIIAAYRQIIARAHARGMKIFGGTLLPYLGAVYATAAGEKKREAVNAWIRTSGAFDAFIDFDKAVRSASDPLVMNPAYDSGDHLHPDDAGYQAMANVVSLRQLLRG